MSSVLEDAAVDDWVDDELEDEASEPEGKPLVPVAAVVGVGLIAGLVFAIMRSSLTDDFDGGWIWERLDWGVMGAVLVTVPLLALNRIPWGRLAPAQLGAAAVTGLIPLIFLATSGPLARLAACSVSESCSGGARRSGSPAWG